MKKIGFLFVLFQIPVQIGIAQIINVPADHPSIQSAINAAADGDTILVAEGTYFENINFRGKAITIASHFLIDGNTSHISNTVINGSQPVYPDSASVVTLCSGEDTTSILTGFTITGGKGSKIFMSPLGVYWKSGGGINIFNSGAKIEDNIITGNSLSATFMQVIGGGISAIPDNNHRNIILKNNQVYGNEIVSSTYAQGGGINAGSENGMTLVEGNIVFKNKVSCTGTWKANAGGIMLGTMHPWTAHMIIRNNFITENEIHCVSSQGGAIFLTFVARGGEYQSGTSNIRIYNNVISYNYSQDRGGGIAMWDQSNVSYQVEHPNPIIYNNTIVGNKARKGAGIFNLDMNALFFNNIIWNYSENEVGEINMDGMSVPGLGNLINYGIIQSFSNDIKGGWPGEGNMNFDPILDTETFELAESSPCIGNGVDSIQISGKWYTSPSFDLSGNQRPHPINDRVDMGAIESQYEGFVYIQPKSNIEESLNLYPNPTNNLLNIDFETFIHGEMEIRNLNGQVIYKRPVQSVAEQIDMTRYPKGIYFVTVRSDAWVRTMKILKY